MRRVHFFARVRIVGIGMLGFLRRRPDFTLWSCGLLSPFLTLFLLQDTETESYVNNAEPWKQGIGGLVAPRVFAARFFVTRCVGGRRGRACFNVCLTLFIVAFCPLLCHFVWVLRACVVCACPCIVAPRRLVCRRIARYPSPFRIVEVEISRHKTWTRCIVLIIFVASPVMPGWASCAASAGA